MNEEEKLKMEIVDGDIPSTAKAVSKEHLWVASQVAMNKDELLRFLCVSEKQGSRLAIYLRSKFVGIKVCQRKLDGRHYVYVDTRKILVDHRDWKTRSKDAYEASKRSEVRYDG